ncbi:MAG: hypothetical protein AAF502_21105 [Bacteroidota bacterium]
MKNANQLSIDDAERKHEHPYQTRRKELAEKMKLNEGTIKECELHLDSWERTVGALELWDEKYRNKASAVNFCMNLELLKFVELSE